MYKPCKNFNQYLNAFLNEEQLGYFHQLNEKIIPPKTLLKKRLKNATLCFNCIEETTLNNSPELINLIKSINQSALTKITEYKTIPIKWIHVGKNEISLYLRKNEWFYPMTFSLFMHQFFEYYLTFILFFL